MDNRTKAVFVLFLLSILVLTFFVYKKYFIDRSYPVYAEVPCDPVSESCFVYRCNPEEEECTGIPDEDTSYYKKVERRASSLPLCDPNIEGCAVSLCEENASDCTITLCDASDSEAECSVVEDFAPDEVESDEQESMGLENESQGVPIEDSEPKLDSMSNS